MKNGDISNVVPIGVAVDADGFVVERILRSGLASGAAKISQLLCRRKKKPIFPSIFREISAALFEISVIERDTHIVFSTPLPEGSLEHESLVQTLGSMGLPHPVISYNTESAFATSCYEHNILYLFQTESSPKLDWLSFGGRVQVIRWANRTALGSRLVESGVVKSWSRIVRFPDLSTGA